MATAPASVASGQASIVATGSQQVDDSSPYIAVDPTNSLKLVSVFTRRDTRSGTTVLYPVASYSIDGGKTWSALGLPAVLPDPTQTTGAPFAVANASGVGIDQNENVYIGVLEATGGFNAGDVLVHKYSFTGASPILTNRNGTAYQWNQTLTNQSGQTAVVNFNLAVDDNVASFGSGSTAQSDPTAGSVYIAWTTNTPPPMNPPVPYNPYVIEAIGSPDGINWPTAGGGGDPATLVSGGHAGPQLYNSPRVAVSQGKAGSTGGRVTVVYDDYGSLALASPTPLDIIYARTATPTNNGAAGIGLAFGSNAAVTTTTVRGNLAGYGLTASAAAPLGIGPAPAIAIDNTLGSDSPYQGRIYVTYVDRSTALNNPTDNTDIFLRYSDNNGASWSAATRVNSDNSDVDGHTEATGTTLATSMFPAGRSQFEPSVAVDKGTGVLALGWIDARDDASRSRTAFYTTTSIDGGSTFSTNTFANTPNQALDAVTGKYVVIGPYSDIASVEGSVSQGTHQAIAIAGGVIHPAWSSTAFGGLGGAHLNIETAQVTYAAGPRIIASTMGPVALTTGPYTSTDHTSESTSFVITFDRPVAVSTVTASKIKVIYHTPSASYVPQAGDPADGAVIPVGVIAPITATLSADGKTATQFVINFATPQSAVGTYSYSVGPGITNLIPLIVPAQVVPDASPVAFTSTNSVPIPDVTTVTDTLTVSGFGASEVAAKVTLNNLQITHTYDSDLIITLISPSGTQVILSNREGGAGHNFTGTSFDDASTSPISGGTAPFSGTFSPDQPLKGFVGGVLNGTWTLKIQDAAPLDTGTLNGWTLTLTSGVNVAAGSRAGSTMDQNADGVLDVSGTTDVFSTPTPTGSTPFQAPFSQTTLPIVIPGPSIVSTFVPTASTTTATVTNTGANGAPVSKTTDNLVTDTSVSSLDVVFDRDMLVSSFTAAQVLRIVGPQGPISGPFTVAAETNPAYLQSDEDSTHVRTFRIGFPAQVISGTYSVSLGSGIRSTRGDGVDVNENAGVARLFQLAPSSTSTTSTTYNATDLTPATRAILPGKTITSTIQVNDVYDIQSVTLGLNITYPNDPDLEATLTFISNDPAVGTIVVPLFTNVGAVGSAGQQVANFTNTVFSDSAATPIQNGSAPFFGNYDPQKPFAALNGLAASGKFVLTIKDDAAATSTASGTLDRWSLTLGRLSDASLSSGLGEPVADRSEASFRIFTLDPTNPLSSGTWTAVGPASNNGGANSSRIGGLAIDPSDPSGNTAYVAGASGGIWKTTNFLTTAGGGPTYTPLTDAGAPYGINIGSIAVFGRNSDPNQSIVVASTGEGDSSSAGVQGGNSVGTGIGFLISFNGGATWNLLDSRVNYDSSGREIPEASRDRFFVGSTSYKVLIDPHLSPTGDVIIYAALSGGSKGGVWRSTDSGRTWSDMRAGQATDLAFDPNSGAINAVSNPTGNLRTLYAGFRGEGVFLSPNQGQTWNPLNGGVGDPLIQDATTMAPVGVGAPPTTPTGAVGRVVLAKPALLYNADGTPNTLLNAEYESWIYAAVATPDDQFGGLYLTKDNGSNWTRVRIPTHSNVNVDGYPTEVVPTNDITQPDYNILRRQANYDIALTIDPNNPNITYLGGTRDFQPTTLIRVDSTRLADPYSLYTDTTRNGGGTLENTTDPVTITNPKLLNYVTGSYDPIYVPALNLYRNPGSPFLTGSTITTSDTSKFANDGSGAWWTPFVSILGGQTDIHRLVAIKDPVTGKTRLIVGLDQGIFTGVDDGTGNVITSVGTVVLPTGARNGNLQINQFYNGATQPSALAAQIAGALFYGEAQDNGFPVSKDNVDKTLPGSTTANPDYGNIAWNGSTGDGTDVATDQTGSGTNYQYRWPCCGGGGTNFFQVDGVGRTFGLFTNPVVNPVPTGGTPDPQWPATGGFNFALNPISPDQILLGSGQGRLFTTQNRGVIWNVLAEPTVFDGTVIPALAFGAPDPNGPGISGALNNYLLVGTAGGHIYVTFTGGGGAASGGAAGTPNAWINLSAGLLDNSPIERIIADPNRGSHDAYAISGDNVYYNSDTSANGSTWTPITGNLFKLTTSPFGDTNQAQPELQYLNALVADWRYVIPNSASNPNGPSHPIVYVAGEAGVYRTTDQGTTWTLFPTGQSIVLPGTTTATTIPDGGYLPIAHVTDLDVALGNVNPTTGRALAVDPSTGVKNSPNLLLATTYGRGSFGIRLAPVIFNSNSTQLVGLSSTLPAATMTTAAGSDTGLSPTDGITNDAVPYISGLSEQTAFGNQVAITIDLVNPDGSLTYIGGYDPSNASTSTTDATGFSNPSNETDAFGRFNVQVAAGKLAGYNGTVNIVLFATDGSGTKGNVVAYSFQLLTTPPPATTAPVLETASDSGRSNTDATTNDNTPTFDVKPTQANSIVELFRRASGATTFTLVATATVPVGTLPSNVAITDPGPVPDGIYYYSTIVEDLAGNFSTRSVESAAITIDTLAPARPPAPTLDPASDTGVKGDGITGSRNPTFDVASGEAAPTATYLYRGTASDGSNAVLVGTNIANGLGLNPVRDATASLADGTYYYFFKQVDLAGNMSALSAGTKVQVLSAIPTTPALTLALDPADDSSHGLSVTRNNDPRLYGSGPVPPANGSGYTLTYVNSDGTVLNGPFADPNSGSFEFQASSKPLAPGTYSVHVQIQDVAGNTASSKPVTFTVKTAGPTIAPSIQLVPSSIVPNVSVTGISGRTTLRRPSFFGLTDPGTSSQPTVVNVYATFAGSTSPVLEATAIAQPTAGGGHPAGYYQVQLPLNLIDGTITLYAIASDVAGNSSAAGNNYRLTVYTAPYDYSAQGHADIGVYRPTTGYWYVNPQSSAVLTQQWGLTGAGDIPVPGDYDGDGTYDYAVFRTSTDTWYLNRSTTGRTSITFGNVGTDIPVPAAYDPSGTTNVAVYRPSTGTWFILHNTIQPGANSTQQIVNFGYANLDQPVPGDYQGNGYAELAVYRPTTGQWIFVNPVTGVSDPQVNLGHQAGDVPVPADYDGIGRTEPALYRPATSTTPGQFIIYNPIANKIETYVLGSTGDIPVPADYFTAGKASPAVWTPSTGFWHYINPNTGVLYTSANWGLSSDIPIEAPYSYKYALEQAQGQVTQPYPGGTLPAVNNAGPVVPGSYPSNSAPAGGVQTFGAATFNAATVSAPASATPAATPAVVVGSAAPAGLTSTGKSSIRPNVATATAPVKVTLAKATRPPGTVSPHDVALDSLGTSIKGKFLG